MFHSFFIVLPLLSAVVSATNDWTTPCFSGSCSWDIPDTAGSSSGTMKIWGSVNAITDITTAAGWMILGCSPDATSQDIRLVCQSTDTTTAGCDHLYQGSGAEGKIVRLPDNCGQSPFARIAKSWVPDDQSIPTNIAARLVRRDGSQPQVKALTLDTDFGAVDTSKAGNVNIAIQGANIPGANGDIDVSALGPQRRSRFAERGFFDFIGDAIDKIKNLDNVNVNKSLALPPISIDKSANLFNDSISCGVLTASVSVDVDGKADANVTLGVAASGTIIPPKLTQFQVFADFTADLDGTLTLKADATGTLDSGKITLFELPIAGLDFPGILTIGPSFQLNAQAKATLDVNLDMDVGISFNAKNAQLFFPPQNGQNSNGAFNLGDTPVKISVSPDVKATGSVEAHLIPTLNVGISALAGAASANVFLDLDASAVLALSLNATAEADVSIGKGSTSSAAKSSASSAAMSTSSSVTKSSASSAVASMKSATSSKMMKRSYYTAAAPTSSSSDYGYVAYAASSASSTESTSVAKSTSVATSTTSVAKSMTVSSAVSSSSSSHSTMSSTTNKVTTTTNTSASFDCCVDLTAGLDISAGASGDFFGLFDKSTSVDLFNKQFQIFQKCFSGSTSKKRSSTRVSSLRKRDGLACPASGVGDAASVVDELVSAADIFAL